ncbi:MAG: M23 family metallopeptidase [Longispora sp.]|nr:M23 family metallopeptidase [Longispora sp. (in: high G+C Gram-positive bacteria)]
MTNAKIDHRMGSRGRVGVGMSVLLLALAGCTSGDDTADTSSSAPPTRSGSASANGAGEKQELTPLLMNVRDAPIPFQGSDGETHLVYELELTNFSSGTLDVERVEVLGETGTTLQSLDASAVAGRLQPAGLRTPTGTMAASTQALLFLNVTLPKGSATPQGISHRITVQAAAAPPGQQNRIIEGDKIEVDTDAKVVLVGPPLRGTNYISADSCCDATRHTRAALPVNNRVWVTQRFAVDWEQLNSEGRIYSGPREDPKSYAIYGEEAIAVTDATVVSTVDGLLEQTPGKFPTDISVEQADGNAVILDLGGGRYALYAHMQPGSLRVKQGDKVKRGDVLGLVGNTGNSLAPHLHFHVMDGPDSLASNGLPYLIDEFQITARGTGTEAFDVAEAQGTPLPKTEVSPPEQISDSLPLDQLIISFE